MRLRFCSSAILFDFRRSVMTGVKREFDTGATQRHLVLGLEITLQIFKKTQLLLRSFCIIQCNKMVNVRNFSLAFGFIAITNEPFDLGI
jgi:hypothetical protein